jgi:hypothetical protein
MSENWQSGAEHFHGAVNQSLINTCNVWTAKQNGLK